MSLTATQKEQCRLQLAEAEAKWVNAVYQDSIGRLTITRRWKVGNDRVDSALEYLNTYGWVNSGAEGTLDTIASPTMGDEAFAGAFRQVRCFDGASVESAGWVYQELRRVQAPATAIALSVLPSLVSSEQEVVRPFGFTSGTKWDMAHVFYDLNPNSKATVEGFASEDLVTQIAGSGWTFVDKKWQEGEDNTASFAVLFKKVEWNNLWTASEDGTAVGARIVGEGNPNDTDGEATRTNEAEGVSKGNLSTVYADAKEDTSVTGGTHNRVVESVSLSERGDGENVVRNVEGQARRMGTTGTLATHSLTINLTPEIGIKNATATRRWNRVEKAYKDALVYDGGLARSDFSCPETIGTTYTHAEVSIAYNGNGVYTVTQSGFASSQLVIDQHKDVRGKGVYFTEKEESVTTTYKLWVRYPIYRHYHVFRKTWNACWDGCDAKDEGGKYPVAGDISIGSFGSYLYHGQVTTFRGWTDWMDASDDPPTP